MTRQLRVKEEPQGKNDPEVQRFRHKREDTLRHIDRGYVERTNQGF